MRAQTAIWAGVAWDLADVEIYIATCLMALHSFLS